MLPRLKYALPLLALLSSLILLPGASKSAVTRQQPYLFTLQASEDVLESSDTFDSIGSIFTSEDNQTLYTVDESSGAMTAYDIREDGAPRPLGTSAGFVNRGSRGNRVRVRGEKVSISDRRGKQLSEFAIPPAVSYAFLGDGSIVVASPGNRHFLHVFNLNGQLLKSFGLVQARDKNGEENRFLSRGRVAVDADDNIYYVSNYVPLIQKFSAEGKLLYEVKVEGDAIDIQQEVAQRFLSNKSPRDVGGITILTGAAIDRQTGHLWISMNGSSNTGVVYEYDSEGNKLREYSLHFTIPRAPDGLIIGVKDIAVTASRLFILSQYSQVYTFDRESASIALQGYWNFGTRTALAGIIPAAWTAGGYARPVQTCGTGQTWPGCSFTCPGPSCVGNPPTPTATSSDGSFKDCKAALAATLLAGYTVLSHSCEVWAANTPDHMRGGCKGVVNTCRDGVPTSHNVTLSCPAPNCPPPGGGGGDGGSCFTDCCGGPALECCSQDEWGCCNCSPILIDVNGDGFVLTDAAGGVNFDLNNDGYAGGVAWTSADTDDAWVALDRNGNGKIDNSSELFGNVTPQPYSTRPNGFAALAEFDKPLYGGNSDGVIDKKDAVFGSLRLWQDVNHNGVSESGELHTLHELGLKLIDLNYKESKRMDEYGNRFRYRAKVRDAKDADLGRKAWDVFLVHAR